jgi:hypothetical protein
MTVIHSWSNIRADAPWIMNVAVCFSCYLCTEQLNQPFSDAR